MNAQGDLDNYEAAWREADKPAGAEGKPEIEAAPMEATAAPAADTAAHDAEFAEGFGLELKPEAERPAPKHEPQSFSEAFAMHRKAGDKVFEWQGKSYNTKLASDKPAAPKAKPAAVKTDTKPAATAPAAAAHNEVPQAAKTEPHQRVTSADVAAADFAKGDFDPKTLLKR
jgi:hypothetical protein